MSEPTKDLQAEIEQLKKQKGKLDAEKALADSQRALDAAKSQSAENLERLKTQKQLSDAQKDAASAQFEAWKTQYFGTVTQATYSGAIDIKNDAGKAEAALLAARAVRTAAANICDAVKGLSGKVVIFAAKEFPDFQRLQTFRFQLEVLKQAFTAAGVTVQAEVKAVPQPEVSAVPTPAAISAGFDAFSKILSFFKTDYTAVGIQLTVDESLLLYSVAGNLAKAKAETIEVHLPITYSPTAKASAITAPASNLMKLATLRSQAKEELSGVSTQQKEKEKNAEDGKEQNKKDSLAMEVADLKARAEKLKGVITLFDNFVDTLTSADAKTGTVPLANLARDYAIEKAIENGHDVLLLRLESSGGGYFIKKNLWTGLFGMPLYHMGGATVTYVLLSGKEGKVLAGDIVPVHGGFVKADELENALKNAVNPSTCRCR
jgi:hypothetical protein